MIGKRVNNFDITRLLGEGGMGAVYEATHSIIPRRVAVKVLRREYAVDSALVQRFFNEARAAHAIRHPNIVEVIDVGMLPEGVPYLIMELLEGESLAHRVGREGKLELATAVDFAAQVADALQVAHSAGIVHRDVKPDHLFLVKDPRQPEREMVKVLDFGIAKLRTDLLAGKVTTNAGTILGTPAYMAPEQCRGVAEGVDHRADVYALGITLYELLCGIPPFIGRGIGDVMMLHMGVAPEPPSRRRSDVPAEIDAVVLKALEKAPENRFQSMSEMAAALRSCLGGAEPPRPRPSKVAPPALFRPNPRNSTPSNLSLPPPPAKPGWSRRTTVAALGALVLVVLGGQAVLRHNGSRPVSALDNDGIEQHSLLLRGEGATPAPAAAPAAASVVARNQASPASAGVTPAASSPASAGVTPAASSSPAPSSPAAVPPPPSVPAAPEAPAAAVTAPGAKTEPALTAAEGSGFLSLDAVPWANVYIGGRMLGTTPLDRLPLPAGRQSLRLENPELEASTEYVVQIEAGRLVSRFVDWEARRGGAGAAP